MTKNRKIDDKTELYVISNTTGELFFVNKENDEWTWEKIGDEHLLTVSDLKTMKGKHLRFFKEKWVRFYESDKDILEFLRLTSFYDGEDNENDIENMLDQDVSVIRNYIASIKNKEHYMNIASQIVMIAKDKFKAGKLTNTHMIDTLEKSLGIVINDKEDEE